MDRSSAKGGSCMLVCVECDSHAHVCDQSGLVRTDRKLSNEAKRNLWQGSTLFLKAAALCGMKVFRGTIKHTCCLQRKHFGFCSLSSESRFWLFWKAHDDPFHKGISNVGDTQQTCVSISSRDEAALCGSFSQKRCRERRWRRTAGSREIGKTSARLCDWMTECNCGPAWTSRKSRSSLCVSANWERGMNSTREAAFWSRVLEFECSVLWPSWLICSSLGVESPGSVACVRMSGYASPGGDFARRSDDPTLHDPLQKTHEYSCMRAARPSVSFPCRTVSLWQLSGNS